MPRFVSKGLCGLCGALIAKSGMGRHLKACRARLAGGEGGVKANKPVPALHLVVEATYIPEYWLHLEVAAGDKLLDLDEFLRAIWLECCGHLSAFKVGEVMYSSYPDDSGMSAFLGVEERTMNVKLGKVFTPDVKVRYDYDFGSTTELTIRALDSYQTTFSRDEPIRILARNEPPPILCDECGQLATEICTQCLWEDTGRLCAGCAGQHECGEDMLLPVLNSPRTGVCGYTGEAYE